MTNNAEIKRIKHRNNIFILTKHSKLIQTKLKLIWNKSQKWWYSTYCLKNIMMIKMYYKQFPVILKN